MKMTKRKAMQIAQQVVVDKLSADMQLKGALLLNYILVQRLGGAVEVTVDEFKAAEGGKLLSHRHTIEDKWRFTAMVPQPEEQKPNIEIVRG